ncbi:DNA-processing protein DprA, partial [Streptomyces sp. T-3]|nr:DNA-processing protein DprA [Streptomyces sp. T-3]
MGEERELERWAGPGVSGAAAGRSAWLAGPVEASEQERLARAALTRVLEPGDEVGGQWLRTYGAVGLMRRLTEDDDLLPGATAKRAQGLRLRAARARPERDLEAARTAGVRFICPGDTEWPAQLADLGDAQPIGLWLRGRADLRIWALRSVAVVGSRAC